MDTPEIVRYCNIMEDIKQRISMVERLLSDPSIEFSPQVRMESVYLQYRKILELIAFSTLVSNLEKFSKLHAKFSKYWHAAELFRDLERTNKDFYPKPVIEELSTNPKVKRHLVHKTTGYLTRGEFLQLYGRAGDILHERNPYAGPSDLDWFIKTAKSWKEKIIGLLNIHTIHLVGKSGFYLIHMEEDDGKVHHYTFAPTDHVPSAAR